MPAPFFPSRQQQQLLLEQPGPKPGTTCITISAKNNQIKSVCHHDKHENMQTNLDIEQARLRAAPRPLLQQYGCNLGHGILMPQYALCKHNIG